MSARKRQRRADKSATHPNRRRGPENPTQTPVSETHRLLSFIATTSLVLGGAFIMVFGILPVGDWLQGTPGQWKPVREWATAVAAIIAVAVLIAAVGREQVDQLVDRATQLIGRPSRRAFEWGMALVVFAFCAFLAQYCFAAQAATGDSMSMRFQARLLASGHLFAVSEAQREFFNTPEALDASGRWFSQFPVGWPLVLAVPMRLGIEWLVAPLLTALTVVWFYRFVAGVIADAPARWTAIMLAVSPWLLFLGSSQENHISVVALLVLALSALPTWVSSSDGRTIARSAALIGVAVASAAAIRPYDAALVGVVVGVFQLTNARTSLHRRSLVVQIAAGAIPLAVLLLANARTAGNPFLFACDALNGPEHRPGFHMTPRGFVLTPTIGLIQTSGKLLRLSTALFAPDRAPSRTSRSGGQQLGRLRDPGLTGRHRRAALHVGGSRRASEATGDGRRPGPPVSRREGVVRRESRTRPGLPQRTAARRARLASVRDVSFARALRPGRTPERPRGVRHRLR
jgi:hypothetical protein